MLRRNKAVAQAMYPVLSFLVLMSSSVAHGIGYVRLDSSGFLRKATDRGDSISTMVIGPEYSTEGNVFSAALDLKAIAFLQDRSSITIEAGNLYVATSPKLMHLHQLTLGRRVYDWSIAEDQWRLGLWSARFTWNPFNPERVGLTGAFYTYQSKKWRVMGFASPISVPERGYPIREDKGKLSSTSPDWVPVPDQMVLMNQAIDIRYTIQYPSIREILVRPGASVQVRYGEEEGFWAGGNYGVMPMHQVLLSAEAAYQSQAKYLDVQVHPRLMYHHLMSAESGYRSKLWSVWASITGESPIQKSYPAHWLVDPMGPAILTSAGAEMKIDQVFAFSASYLGVDEDKPAASGDVALNLSSRFEYKRALQTQARWTGIPRVLGDVRWVYDLGAVASLISMDLTYQPTFKNTSLLNSMFGNGTTWTVGLGADFIVSPQRTGFIGQYAGNDRIRGRISYAF